MILIWGVVAHIFFLGGNWIFLDTLGRHSFVSGGGMCDFIFVYPEGSEKTQDKTEKIPERC